MPAADTEGDEEERSVLFWMLIGLVVVIPVAVVGTVIFSAVISSFVLGLGGESAAAGGSPTPMVQWEGSYDANAGEMTVIHAGGDTVQHDRISITVDGQPVEYRTFEDGDSGGEIGTGDGLVVDAEPGSEVRVLWEDGSGETVTMTSIPAE